MVSEGGRRDDPHVPLILKFSWKVVCESHGILTIQGVVKEWVVQCKGLDRKNPHVITGDWPREKRLVECEEVDR